MPSAWVTTAATARPWSSVGVRWRDSTSTCARPASPSCETKQHVSPRRKGRAPPFRSQALLGNACREALLRGGEQEGKRGFLDVRSQAELGNEDEHKRKSVELVEPLYVGTRYPGSDPGQRPPHEQRRRRRERRARQWPAHDQRPRRAAEEAARAGPSLL